MKITNVLVITFYTLFFLAFGLLLIYLSIGLIQLPEVLDNIAQFYRSSNLSVTLTGVVGILFVMISVLFVLHLLEGIFKKEKGILFSGANGITTVSLSAVEDIIRRAGSQFLDIKVIRPRVNIKRHDINISANIVLYSGVNVPGLTENLQTSIKEHLREVLGIENEIRIKIHIIKIVEKSKKVLKKEPPSVEMQMGK